MFTDRQLNRYADVLMWGLRTARKKRLKKNDPVLIRLDAAALPLAEKLYSALVADGLNPVIRLNPTGHMERSFYGQADSHQLDFVPPWEPHLARSIQGSIALLAPASLTHLADVDAGKIGQRMKAHRGLRKIFIRREARGEYGWTLCVYPTPALAGHAETSLEAYSRQIVKACFLDKKDPVRQWQAIHRRAGRIKKWLNRMDIKRLHIESARIDLTLGPGKERQWVGITGRNIPSFELFVSPDWRLTRGVFYADQPSFRNGNLVEGVRLEFADGRAKHITATRGERFVKQQLALDDGAGRLGEFSLTDRRFSRINRFMANTLYDENFGGPNGNCHIAVGASYSNTFYGDPAELTAARKRRLGFNDSAIHWDFVNTEKKRVTARLSDGSRRIIYENGVFTLN